MAFVQNDTEFVCHPLLCHFISEKCSTSFRNCDGDELDLRFCKRSTGIGKALLKTGCRCSELFDKDDAREVGRKRSCPGLAKFLNAPFRTEK